MLELWTGVSMEARVLCAACLGAYKVAKCCETLRCNVEVLQWTVIYTQPIEPFFDLQMVLVNDECMIISRQSFQQIKSQICNSDRWQAPMTANCLSFFRGGWNGSNICSVLPPKFVNQTFPPTVEVLFQSSCAGRSAVFWTWHHASYGCSAWAYVDW